MIQDMILAGFVCVGFYALQSYVKYLCRGYFVQRQR